MRARRGAAAPRRGETRQERAARLRPVVRRWVEVLGLNGVAARTEMHPAGIREFIHGRATPIPAALDAYEEMLAADDPESGFADWEPTPENIDALPPPLRRYIRALESSATRPRARQHRGFAP